jgi:hypothetical protein
MVFDRTEKRVGVFLQKAVQVCRQLDHFNTFLHLRSLYNLVLDLNIPVASN